MTEFGRIPRACLDASMLARLQAFDEFHAGGRGEPVFDWSRTRFIRARNYVGVIQVPGLTIEILPKIDHASDDAPTDDRTAHRARHNLLYMLAWTRRIHVRERDLADQQLRRMGLLEALVLIFVKRLLFELRRGVPRTYVRTKANMPFLKGKLVFGEHIRHNIVRRDRSFVSFDDFTDDNPLNQILRATCRRLLASTSANRVMQGLAEAMLELCDVTDVEIRPHDFDSLHLDRSSERFGTLLSFCRMVLFGLAPAPESGGERTFSLLFPMDQVYESFIGMTLWRHAHALDLERRAIHIQATGRRRWLLRSDDDGSRRFQLRPDIIVDEHSGYPGIIIDTKWKRLLPDSEDRTNGVAQSDMYQLYAYAQRYNSDDNVLLYPHVPGVTPKAFTLEDDPRDRRIRIAFVDLGIDLQRERRRFLQSLHAIVHPPLHPVHPSFS